jgi:HEAT repeat protein
MSSNRRGPWSWGATAALVAVVAGRSSIARAESPQGGPAEDAVRAVVRAVAEAGEIPEQARTLARLAWPAQDDHDPAVAAEARRVLSEYGLNAFPALREALTAVKREYQADVVRVLLEVRRKTPVGLPQDYLGALDDAVWFGTREARAQAMPEVAKYQYHWSLLPIIDVAIEDAELLPAAIEALGVMGDSRARFFLSDQLMRGAPPIQAAAAVALARIGGRALEPVREALQSSRRSARLAAIRAILAVATVDDLSALYEYYDTHRRDDPELAERVRETAGRLEEELQTRQAADAASANPSDER